MFRKFLILACASDDATTIETGAESQSQPNSSDDSHVPDDPISDDLTRDADAPIPVEPNGGIGNGAGPIPGLVDETDDGTTWHGAVVAEMNCPGMRWTRVQASAFSFSVPSDFVDEQVQGVDLEAEKWSGPSGITVSFDYGPYSASDAWNPGAEVTAVDYSGRIGEHVVIRSVERNRVAVLFPEVELNFEQWNGLGMAVGYDDPNDEIVGRCIVGSIEWST